MDVESLISRIMPIVDRANAFLMQQTLEAPLWWTMSSLKDRVGYSFLSIFTLRKAASHSAATDSWTLLRSMYDAHLQFLYICAPSDREEVRRRAHAYYAFGILDHQDYYHRIMRSPTQLAKEMEATPPDEHEQLEVAKAVEEWKPQFADRTGRLRATWYPGTLRDLARDLSKAVEYDFLLRICNMATHSSPASRFFRKATTADRAVFFALVIVARVFLALSRLVKQPLSKDETELLEILSGNHQLNS